MKIKVTILGSGTSQGVPLIACSCVVCNSSNDKDKRLRSSIKIEVENKTFVIDSGPDFRQQMLRSNTKQLNALIFTHEHKDHIAGMDDIRAFNYVNKSAIDVYATDRVEDALKREYAYIFSDEKYPGIPEINLINIENKPFFVQDIEVVPIQVYHYKLPVLGFRFGDFTYITDANFINDDEKAKIKGSKVLIVNALRREQHISHFTMEEAITLGQELKVPQIYFTHISHQLGLHYEVEKELPQGFHLAYDGLEILVD
jgi:phosphoribosyl 1,2-cyclic phosphate phosphodiesterase